MGPIGLFLNLPAMEAEPEQHDFRCGVSCVRPCMDCLRIERCMSYGAHKDCDGCEWRENCLKEGQ
ncbi:hypothetical protein FACS189479_05560 [Spirochaetia bacterium]|nr:hypothetical protein FACS189479_05560 [Spirochaetia bacterium]